MKDAVFDTVILVLLFTLVILVLSGCTPNNSSIIDIRDKPPIELGGWIPPFDIENFERVD
jgi:hypothetical protein